MKFICEGSDLKNAISTVSHAANGRTLNPILEGIKIVAEKDQVTFFATDLELYIRSTIHATVKEEGSAVLPGKLFGEYIAKVTDGQITFTSSNDTAVIEHGDANNGNFSCLPIKEYPDLVNLSAKPSFSIKAGELRDVITKSTPFTSTDNSRPVLRGTLFQIDATSNTLTTVSLNGFRLSKLVKPIIKAETTAKIIIPASALDQMKRMIIDDNDIINIIIENKFVQIQVGSTVFASRLIDGEFVNYKQIIPTAFNSNIVVETAPFRAAVGRAGLLYGVGKVNVLTLSTKDKQVEINANNEMGKINERVPANLDGQDIKIAFNAKYLFDALNTITDDFITISFNGALAPCVITGAKKEDYLFLVLPVRLG